MPSVRSGACPVEPGFGRDMCTTVGDRLRPGAAPSCTASLRRLSVPLPGETFTVFAK